MSLKVIATRSLLAVLLGVVLLLALAVGFGVWLLGRAGEAPAYVERRGSLSSVETLAVHQLADSTIEEIVLESDSGLTFSIALRIPDEPLPERPLIVLLAGNETGRKAATLINDPGGVAVAAMSYPFAEIPYREWGPMIRALPNVQQGILDTPSAVLLAIDYLLGREDLAVERLELVGVSFGAYLVAVPAVLDERVDRLWLVHGSGIPDRVIENGLEGRLPTPWLRAATGDFLAGVAGAEHLSPELWVEQVAPRPIVAISADADESIPRDAIDVLHDVLPDGTEVLWTPGDHVHPKRPEIMNLLSSMILERVELAVGAPPTVRAAAATAVAEG